MTQPEKQTKKTNDNPKQQQSEKRSTQSTYQKASAERLPLRTTDWTLKRVALI
jgi:hypothetical protein